MEKKTSEGSAAIDFVIPWVNGNDPAWQKEKAAYVPSEMADSASEVRYRDWDNLQYWFRGVEKYAPWVNRVYFITWGHLPEWLNTSAPKLKIVKHGEYMHRIDGLSEHFVYFNDDMFLTKPVKPTDFFKNGNPCENFGLNCVYFGQDSAGHFIGSNMEVINTEFKGQKRSIMKRDWRKWFSLKNSRTVRMKTLPAPRPSVSSR